jgi:selenocysteine-specific translation elongation factor
VCVYIHTHTIMYTQTQGADMDAPAELHIDDTFYVAGVGTVVAGN